MKTLSNPVIRRISDLLIIRLLRGGPQWMTNWSNIQAEICKTEKVVYLRNSWRSHWFSQTAENKRRSILLHRAAQKLARGFEKISRLSSRCSRIRIRRPSHAWTSKLACLVLPIRALECRSAHFRRTRISWVHSAAVPHSIAEVFKRISARPSGSRSWARSLLIRRLTGSRKSVKRSKRRSRLGGSTLMRRDRLQSCSPYQFLSTGTRRTITRISTKSSSREDCEFVASTPRGMDANEQTFINNKEMEYFTYGQLWSLSPGVRNSEECFNSR